MYATTCLGRAGIAVHTQASPRRLRMSSKMGGVLTPAQCESAMWRGSKAAAVVRGVWAAVLRVVGGHVASRRVCQHGALQYQGRFGKDRECARCRVRIHVGCGWMTGKAGNCRAIASTSWMACASDRGTVNDDDEDEKHFIHPFLVAGAVFSAPRSRTASHTGSSQC